VCVCVGVCVCGMWVWGYVCGVCGVFGCIYGLNILDWANTTVQRIEQT